MPRSKSISSISRRLSGKRWRLYWGLTSTVLSLGIRPVENAKIDLYRCWADDCLVPQGIQDVGVRTEPNLEVVAALKPDLIITTPFSESVCPFLERIPPTYSFATYTPEGHPLNRSAEVLREIARETGGDAQAEAVLARVEASFAATKRSLEGQRIEPLLLAGFVDGHHVRIYGTASLFGNVLNRLGIPNAWDRPTNFWDFFLIGIHELAAYPDARFLAVAPDHKYESACRKAACTSLDQRPDSFFPHLVHKPKTLDIPSSRAVET
ncbi:ABC transporter substrate-binding protein [Microvirga sp. BSC39]|uniref:ABC transporter substrate-binding protein n=1 Tax=Microvirga sp. BSC39 TaxID=1549810 RepID=UPI0009DE348E|nr:ABC transporter substrate-binding protein [Microvirga sp. BSC39]